MLKEWLLCHEISSERLREEMAHWVVWLSNDSPPFAAYRAVNSARMLAADKSPLACGEIWMRLWADCLNTETKVGATTACGNVNLCACLRAGIEGNLHAVRAIWPQSRRGGGGRWDEVMGWSIFYIRGGWGNGMVIFIVEIGGE